MVDWNVDRYRSPHTRRRLSTGASTDSKADESDVLLESESEVIPDNESPEDRERRMLFSRRRPLSNPRHNHNTTPLTSTGGVASPPTALMYSDGSGGIDGNSGTMRANTPTSIPKPLTVGFQVTPNGIGSINDPSGDGSTDHRRVVSKRISRRDEIQM